MCLLRQGTKYAKINKCDYIKWQGFYTGKETINKRKRPPIGYETVFASDIFDKGLISKICKELINPTSKITNNPIKIMGGGPEWTFFQRRHTDYQQTGERCPDIMLSVIIPVIILKCYVSHIILYFLVNFIVISSGQVLNNGHFKSFVTYRELLF